MNFDIRRHIQRLRQRHAQQQVKLIERLLHGIVRLRLLHLDVFQMNPGRQ